MISNPYPPQVVSYLPFLYIIWADGLLTESELDVVRNTVRSDDTLSDEDREIMVAFLDPDHVPADEVYHTWKDLFKQSDLKFNFEEDYPLTDYAMRLAEWASPDYVEMPRACRASNTTLDCNRVNIKILFRIIRWRPLCVRRLTRA